jgi:hypothetical protein
MNIRFLITVFAALFVASTLVSCSGGWKEVPGTSGKCTAKDAQMLKQEKYKNFFLAAVNRKARTNPCNPGKAVDLKCSDGRVMVECE